MTLHDAEVVGAHGYEAVITRTPTPDPWPENDRASVRWSPASTPRVLGVSGDAGKISAALRSFDPEIVTPSAFPSDLRDLLAANRQVVVLDAGVTFSWRSSLRRWMRLCGRPAGGCCWRKRFSRKRRRFPLFSPVFSAASFRIGWRAQIVFVLDASGSMNESAGVGMPDQKFRLASRGVRGALELLHADDRLAVLAFNDGVQRIGVGTKREIETGLEERLLRVQPTGPTSPDVALREISSGFSPKKAADAPGDGGASDRWRNSVDGCGGAGSGGCVPVGRPASPSLHRRRRMRILCRRWLRRSMPRGTRRRMRRAGRCCCGERFRNGLRDEGGPIRWSGDRRIWKGRRSKERLRGGEKCGKNPGGGWLLARAGDNFCLRHWRACGLEQSLQGSCDGGFFGSGGGAGAARGAEDRSA